MKIIILLSLLFYQFIVYAGEIPKKHIEVINSFAEALIKANSAQILKLKRKKLIKCNPNYRCKYLIELGDPYNGKTFQKFELSLSNHPSDSGWFSGLIELK